MKISIIVSVIILAMVSMGMADGFIGTFTGTIDGQRYDLTMERHPDGYYDGTLSGGGQTTVLRGFRQDNQLIGSVLVEGQQSPFIARVQADGGLYFQDQNGDSVVFQPMSASSSAGQGDQAPAQSAAGKRSVYINRVKMKDETLQAYETAYKVKIENGRYWYDVNCGAWGVENGPTVGFILAGLDLPRPMPADISGRGTQIFINGREIHQLDKNGFEQLFGISIPGRYWMDAHGNLGQEGGPVIVNVFAAIRAAQQKTGSVTHGYGSTYGARGTLSGGHIYSGRTASGKSVFWYPGM